MSAAKYTHCIECGEVFSGSNVHSVEGALETQISGMCEDCFDEVCADIEDEHEDAYVYAVLPGQETPDEPQAGWYYAREDGDPHGPFNSKEDAERLANYRGEDNAHHEGAAA